jgi:nicotinate-nucleotide adenylyltransferase
MDCEPAEPLLRSCLERFCKPKRIEHSISVAETAVRLCRRFGVDEKEGFLAGLAHDLMKDRPLDIQWDYACRAASEPSLDHIAALVARIESKSEFSDKIIHGPAASVFVFEEGILRQGDILEAVALHSSAAETMSPLAKILFIADKMEPKRPYIAREDIVSTERLDLDELLLRALGLSLDWLKTRNHAIAQSSIDLYNALTTRKISE